MRPELLPTAALPGTPAPRTDLLLPFRSALAHAAGQADCYHVLERRDATGAVEQRGVIGALDLRGTETGHILRHSQVSESEVRTQARLLQRSGGAAEPLLLAAPDPGGFRECAELTTRRPPDSVLSTPDGGEQRLWACAPRWTADPPALPPVLLADGHHRLAAARRMGRVRMPALVVDHARYPLTLSATHRIVPGLDAGRAARAAARFARVRSRPAGVQGPLPPGTFVLTGGGKAWEISRIAMATVAGRLRFLPSEWAELDAAISDHVLIPALCEEQGILPRPRHVTSQPSPADPGVILPRPTWNQVWAGVASGAGLPRKSASLGPKPVLEHIAAPALTAVSLPG
ncbi:DUF1015 domain-containing protein [Streptomyces sodiiphilus]|uniref:DUF1015 domain-containing protein n=1 Tax=Streptomyces sodiiphilus TaxID=226217 RepID=A0ABN2PUN1_9ACTN